jgi:hypothetical protein
VRCTIKVECANKDSKPDKKVIKINAYGVAIISIAAKSV